MLIKSMTAGIVGTALLTSVAFAQTPSTSDNDDKRRPSHGEQFFVPPRPVAHLEAGRP